MTDNKISEEAMKDLLSYLNIYNKPQDPVQKKLQTDYYNSIYLPRVSGPEAQAFFQKAIELREKAKRAANKMRSHTIIGYDAWPAKSPEKTTSELPDL